ncbi:RCC1 and BTB domain-containing protein 2-like isoform X2 [Oppia nitens]|uniref:RCC1 and BTB domain-containing protein 2-like isoform X2 n=1 Tax=Oppia nitens TaxID=1686743 RepID=UPI0023DC852E|nr:RCC1 and BTB domain-containing protein 2-like isoform X2 [Oppia nitens]
MSEDTIGYQFLLTDRLTMGSIDKWLIFSLLREPFISNIRMFSVFGCSGNEAIIVTKDDEVYALGSNCSLCLGLGEVVGSPEPRRIDCLAKKAIIKIAAGSGPHVCALTASGELYTWGHNTYHQLGNGNTNPSSTPLLVTSNLMGKRVIDVFCGSYHTLVLTDDGEVYAWGQNNCGQIGSGSTTNQPTPRKVTAGIGSRTVVAIACGQICSMAVLDSGEVFSWGYNGNGQLGLGTNANQPNPMRVTNLNGVVIQKVVCGNAHTLLLSDDGTIYAFGSNSYGQLGTGSKSNQTAPIKVAANLGRFIDIAASHYTHISASITQEGKCYMWGQCRGHSITTPIETPFQSTHDVLATFATPSVTFRSVQLCMSPINRVLDSLSQAFNDEKTSDFKFIVDNKPIYVHKAILRVRCEHFRLMFDNNWAESTKDELEMTQYSYAVYCAFLQYLYTDDVSVAPEDGIGLLDLANSYCETDLKQKCERLIRNGITVENVAMLYSAAIKFDAKGLEDYCFRFSLVHLTAVVQTDAFNKLDENTLKSFITKAALNGAFKH